jgi:PD-(D/E)XK endonuclease
MKLRQENPREQGAIGERVAAAWLMHAGYHVWFPFGHSPHVDLLAEEDGRLWRVQVKTSTHFRKGRWVTAVCTRGGNRSWNGIVKKLDPSQYDLLFVLVADGRMWLIPAEHVGGGSGLSLGGPKYERFEVHFRQSVGEAGFEPA